MPGWSLILIEMVTPKVILFSTLSFVLPTPPHQPPLLPVSLGCLAGFSALRPLVPSLGWARAPSCRGSSSCQLCCFLPSVFRGDELDAGWGEGTSPGLIFRV